MPNNMRSSITHHGNQLTTRRTQRRLNQDYRGEPLHPVATQNRESPGGKDPHPTPRSPRFRASAVNEWQNAAIYRDHRVLGMFAFWNEAARVTASRELSRSSHADVWASGPPSAKPTTT